MQKVTLETKDGRFVAHCYIPPFEEPPEILVWGQRVFAIRVRLHERWIYREASMFAIIDEEEKSK